MTTEPSRYVEDARPIAQTANLRTVRQLRGTFKASAPPNDVVSVDVSVDETSALREDDVLVIQVPFRLAVRTAGEDGHEGSETPSEAEPCFEVTALFVLTYSIPDLGSHPDETVEAFGMANAVFNAWPYWREYVQSCTRRADYPNVLVPVLRIEDGNLVMGGDS